MNLEILLARRYLSSSKGAGLSAITWIALAGVVVGVMSLVAVLAVMSGFDHELRSKILGNNAHILISLARNNLDAKARTPEEILAFVRKNPGVGSAMPVIYGEAFALSPNGGSEGISLRGVDPVQVQKVLDLKAYSAEGNWKGLEQGGVMLGDILASKLNLSIGDSFTLLLNRGEFSPLGIVPKMRKLKLIDTFHSGMSQFDAYHGYINLNLAEELFETSSRNIEVRTKDIRKLGEITRYLRKEIPEAIFVEDWLAQNKDFLSALRLEKTAMAVILGLIVLVAALNICGSLIMIVKDKTRDIAILKSMGARDQSILRIFFIQGMFVGGVGTFVGVLFGFLLSILLRDFIHFPLDREVYMIDTLPVDIRASDVIAVVMGALGISAIATIYPARLAARLNPTEGLKVDS